MKSSNPDISAPLSRSKNKNQSSDAPAIDAALVVLTLFGAVTIFAVCIVLMMVLHPRSSYNNDNATTSETGQLLRSSSSPKQQQQQQLVLTTKHGSIKIQLRPDLSPESVQHIRQLTQASHCDKCQFYRGEKDLLLQGIMRIKEVLDHPSKGKCPFEYQEKAQNCPPHDPQCACHGPTMTKGMVGWAGGGTGPDFFINVFETPVDWWGQQHTVWGMVEDVESLDRIRNQILAMPTHNEGGMNMLEHPFAFGMAME